MVLERCLNFPQLYLYEIVLTRHFTNFIYFCDCFLAKALLAEFGRGNRLKPE